MKNYAIGADERWPTMMLMEVSGDNNGYPVPDRLVNKLEKAHRMLSDAEEAIEEYTGFEDWGS